MSRDPQQLQGNLVDNERAEEEWIRLRETGSVEAYEEYLAKWPDQPFAVKAKSHLATLLRERVIATPEDRALRRRYLAVRPGHLETADAGYRRVPVMPAVANWRILVAALCGGGAAGLVLAGGVLLSRLLRSCGEEWLMLAFAVVLVVANLIALPVGGWIKRRDHRYNPGHHVALSALLACGLLACTCGFQWYLDASAGDPLRAVLLPVAVGIGVGATVESWRCWRRLVVQFRQLGGEFGPLPAKAPCDPEVVRTQYL